MAPRLLRAVVLAALLSVGCGGDSGNEAPAADPAGDSSAVDSGATAAEPAAPPAPEASNVGVEEYPWAEALEVRLGEMERQESGLYIQVLAEGRGEPAEPGDAMGVHYTVWLPNGDTLDSSHDHDPPAPLSMVLGETSLIDGWVEGVTGMRLGERRRLVVPYELAYGARGRTGVPPYTPLLFEVELAEHDPRD